MYLAPSDWVYASTGAVVDLDGPLLVDCTIQLICCCFVFLFVNLDGGPLGLLGCLPGNADEQVYANVHRHHVRDAVPPDQQHDDDGGDDDNLDLNDYGLDNDDDDDNDNDIDDDDDCKYKLAMEGPHNSLSGSSNYPSRTFR